jgi:hypothetical protein
MTDDSLLAWVKSLEHIRYETRNGETVFYSSAPEQLHIQKLLKEQRPHRIARRTCRNRPHPDKIQSTPKTWTNSLIFRRNQLTKQAYRHHERFVDQSFEANQTFGIPLAPQRDEDVVAKPLKRFKSTLFENDEKSFIVEHEKTQSDKSNKTSLESHFSFFTRRQTDEVRRLQTARGFSLTFSILG